MRGCLPTLSNLAIIIGFFSPIEGIEEIKSFQIYKLWAMKSSFVFTRLDSCRTNSLLSPDPRGVADLSLSILDGVLPPLLICRSLNDWSYDIGL